MASITLRRARWSECWLLWRWRNDPHTRAMFVQQQPVSRLAHLWWFVCAMLNPTIDLFMAEYDGARVGTGRIHYTLGYADISVTVAPEYRGLGLATPMIEALVATCRAPCMARIRAHNIASRRAFTRAGFRRIQETPEWIQMVLVHDENATD